jgi:hypothetical protein
MTRRVPVSIPTSERGPTANVVCDCRDQTERTQTRRNSLDFGCSNAGSARWHHGRSARRRGPELPGLAGPRGAGPAQSASDRVECPALARERRIGRHLPPSTATARVCVRQVRRVLEQRVFTSRHGCRSSASTSATSGAAHVSFLREVKHAQPGETLPPALTGIVGGSSSHARVPPHATPENPWLREGQSRRAFGTPPGSTAIGSHSAHARMGSTLSTLD